MKGVEIFLGGLGIKQDRKYKQEDINEPPFPERSSSQCVASIEPPKDGGSVFSPAYTPERT